MSTSIQYIKEGEISWDHPSIAYDHNEDHIMGERDNHIATRTSHRPWRRLLTHGHGEEEVDDGVDGEVQPREEETAGGSPPERRWP